MSYDWEKYSWYIDKIGSFSLEYHKKYGDVWWCSLIAEKNATKSKTYHRIIKKLPLVKYPRWKAILGGVKKIFSFVSKYKFKSTAARLPKKTMSRLSFHYSSLFLPYLDTDIGTITIDDSLYSFLSVTDFFYVFIHFLLWQFRSHPDLDAEYEEDLQRSFHGDVLVETLFHRIIFGRIRKRYAKVTHIDYIYEGLAWEKSMLLAFDAVLFKDGYMLSFPAPGILNYYMSKIELRIAPRPFRLFVQGGIPSEYMRKYFIGVKPIPSTRYDYLQNITSNLTLCAARAYTLILLSHDDEVNKELIDWVCARKDDMTFLGETTLLIKMHPDNMNQLRDASITKVNCNMWDILPLCRRVIVHDSSAMIEALAYKCNVVTPELTSFIPMHPYVDNSKPFNIKDYILC